MNNPLKKATSPAMFDAIAHRYDYVNNVISLGQHHTWRRTLVDQLPANSNLNVLDLATGTADVAIELAKNGKVKHVLGVDLSQEMLDLGQKKVQQQGLDQTIRLQAMDATNLIDLDNSFDAATMSFGIRNVPDPVICLKEIYKALKPGGKVLILESGRPKNRYLKKASAIYLNLILPNMGALLSGHDKAYKYLNDTILDFPYAEGFVDMLHQASFSDAGFRPLFLGNVYLYWGHKP